MKTKLIMKYPTTWHNDMWREGAPFGNGLIGGLVYGGAAKEIIALNHAFLWRGGTERELPDVSDMLPRVRELLECHCIEEADSLITDTLHERGYSTDQVLPMPLCDIRINTAGITFFQNYRRTVDMEKAEVTVSWDNCDSHYIRRTFVSREDNLVYTIYTCENGEINADISLAVHDTETLREDIEIPDQFSAAKEEYLYFAAYNKSIYKSGDYGAVSRIIIDGEKTDFPTEIRVQNAHSILIVTKVFLETPRETAFRTITDSLKGDYDYEDALHKHAELHAKIFNRVDFSITDDKNDSCNEQLLLEAFDKEASNELIEKLYAYGRYLFICCASDKGTLPCHLTGLFNGSYLCYWAFNMYNVNFQMIYWQALTGNMASYLRSALDYIENSIPQYRENARKIFGCRGILINSVNTPESGLYKCLAHHITNWTGAAAWIAQHFWDYYCFTEDWNYLREHAMPFMYEVALFYEDFAVKAEDGYYDIYPSVSPENTAVNVIEKAGRSDIETSKNATMEVALMKELLHNLVKGCEITGLYPEKVNVWKTMLSKIRPYAINDEGAIKEWIDGFYLDNNRHRHYSHIYPLFPGHEITRKDKLYPCFQKATELRLKSGLYDQCNWSSVYAACIFARMNNGERALKMLQLLSKTCLMNNLFTAANDWRRMGPVSCDDFRVAPFQIDGNIGIPSAINEMLLQSGNGEICIFPALPREWEKGHLNGVCARSGIVCDISWDSMSATVTLKSDRKQNVSIIFGGGYKVVSNDSAAFIVTDGGITIHCIKK